MNVAEFIEWLKTQDQDATVEVLVMVRQGPWEADLPRETPFNPSLSWATDLRDHKVWNVAERGPAPNTLLLGEV